MDPEKPHSLGSLATRMACTLIGLLLLYVLSAGPAFYVDYKYPRSRAFIERLYDPLERVLKPTPLVAPFAYYVFWWMRLAGYQPAD